jgi:hypothetical protein
MPQLSRRALGRFWLVLLLALGAGGGALHWMGPPKTAGPVAATPGSEPEPPAPESPAPGSEPESPAPKSPAPGPTLAEGPAPTAPAPMAPPTAVPTTTPPVPPPVPPLPPPVPSPVAAPLAPPPLAAGAFPRRAADPLIPPPDPTLLERGRYGLVPVLGADGRTSIRAYARAFDREDRRPRIGIILGGMGLNAQHSEEAIRRLPGAVTLAFSPYAPRPDGLLERARARGMEALTALPLEPAGFGVRADPGDRALLTTLPRAENLDRLDWALSRMQGQVGAVGAEGAMRGERFAENAELLGAVQEALTQRGLLYVEARPGGPQPARAFGRAVDVVIDEPSRTRPEVLRQLAALEDAARRNGSALGLAADPAPSVVAALESWAAELGARGFVLAPITVLLRRPADAARQ